MSSAKVTSKGQVTIPVDIRRALDVDEGDFLVFELKGQYATVRRQRTLAEVSAEIRRTNAGRTALYASDDDAVASGIAEEAAEQAAGDAAGPLLLLRPRPKEEG